MTDRLVDVPVMDIGSGAPILLLHGGGGPQSVAMFAEILARQARVLLPTHPGFGGSSLIDGVHTVADIARLYCGWIERMELPKVTLVGVSIGGWIACEMALSARDRVAALVLVDSVGFSIEGEEVLDVFETPRERMPSLTYHNPSRFASRPDAQNLHQQEAMAANLAALAHYGRAHKMQDATLAGRMASLHVPTLVLWGESDGVVSPAYGRAVAGTIPGASFALIEEAGHFPQIERPERLGELVMSMVPLCAPP
jgi:pimeloyl-ACP methyl ester carboxylesterase